MTPALKAMVEAMVAELMTQQGWSSWNKEPNAVSLDGQFDLEKVARAGLDAAEPLLLAEFQAEAAQQQCMDDAVAAEWEGVDRDE